MDALFTHFLNECNLEGYDVAGDYWICVDESREITQVIEMVFILPWSSIRRFKRTPYLKIGV